MARSRHFSGSGCCSPLCLLLQRAGAVPAQGDGLGTPGDAVPRAGLARSIPHRERLGCGRSRSRGK